MIRRMQTTLKCSAFLLAALCIGAVHAQTGAAAASQRGLKSFSQELKTLPKTVQDIKAQLARYEGQTVNTQAYLALLAEPVPADLKGKSLADFHVRRAAAADAIGDAKRRIDELKAAEKHVSADISQLDPILANLTNALAQGGSLAEFMEKVDERYNRLKNSRYKGGIIATLQNMSRSYAKAGMVRQAKEKFVLVEQALADAMQNRRAAEMMEYWWRFMVELNHADIERVEGRYGEEEVALRTALEFYDGHIRNITRRGGGEDLADPLNPMYLAFSETARQELASALIRNAKPQEAELVARQLLSTSLNRTGRYSVGAAKALFVLAQAVAEQGRTADATYLTEQALLSLDRAGVVHTSRLYMVNLRYLAGLKVLAGQCLPALAHYAELAGIRAQLAGIEYKQAEQDLLRVRALLQCQRTPEALALAQSIHDYSSRARGAEHYQTGLSRGFLAMALLQSGRTDEALEHFRAATPVLLKDELGWAKSLKQESVKRNWVMLAYMDLLATRNAALPAQALVEESFLLSDVPRSQAVQLAISASATRSSSGTPKLAEMVREEQDTRRGLSEAYDALFQMLASPPEHQVPAAIEEIKQRIEKQRAAVARLRKDIEREFPKYSTTVDPKPAGLQAVRSALQADEAFVSILPADQRTFVWVVPKTGDAAFYRVDIAEGTLGDIVQKLRTAVDPGAVALGDIPKYDVVASHRVYAEVLHPGRPVWGKAGTLVVATSGALNRLPLAALATDAKPVGNPDKLLFDQYRSVAWLGRTHAFAYVPSATALVSLRQQLAGDASRQPFIAFGDPEFTLAAADSKAAGEQPRLRSVVNSRSAAAAGEYVSLPQLPDTRDEVLAIANALKVSPDGNVYLGRAASKISVNTAPLKARRVIAFATHGLIPGDLPGLGQPALALSPTSAEDDGLLTLEDILKLKLDADWVVLSACNTAAADDSIDSLTGLGPGFFYAGARAILATHWPVESVSARELVTGIFQQAEKNPQLSRAQALKLSINGMLEGRQIDPASNRALFSYAHPIFWAPYTLLGDGR